MRNRLQFSFWGMHLTADGTFAISVSLLIVIILAVATRL